MNKQFERCRYRGYYMGARNKRKSLHVQLARAILFIHNANLKTFSTLKNSSCPLVQRIKVQRWALVLISCLIPCHRCEKSRNSHHLITQRGKIHARTPKACAWISADTWHQDGAICSKNRKIIPYHRCAQIPRLWVSVPDYGSWWYFFSDLSLIFTKENSCML